MRMEEAMAAVAAGDVVKAPRDASTKAPDGRSGGGGTETAPHSRRAVSLG